MKIPHQFSLALTLIISIWLLPNKGAATIGLAEWQVYTPGGNEIGDSDAWIDLCGDGICLRSDSNLNLEQLVFVSDLKRWRFYQDYVIGETKNDYFIFNEVSKEIKRYSTEKQFLDQLEKANLGEAKSPWLTAHDGWEEAWFPIVIWKPCQDILNGENVNESQTLSLGYSDISKEVCQQKLAPKQLVQYRERTWGRQCRNMNFNELPDNQEGQNLKEFCYNIMNAN